MQQSGFTLLELLVTLSVALVLLVLGIPAFSQIIDSNRLTTTSSSLVVALNSARQEAVVRGQPTAVCPSLDGNTCTGGTEWNKGWLAFVDAGGTPGNFDAGDTLLQVNMRGGKVSVSGPTVVRYTALGQLDSNY